MTTLYGIKNCDTVKKAKKWLEQQNIPYNFHDFRDDGLTESLLNSFIDKSDLNQLLNKRSTSFRNLSDDIKNNLSEVVVIKAMLEQPTLIKRPVLLHDQKLTLGFKAEIYQALFN